MRLPGSLPSAALVLPRLYLARRSVLANGSASSKITMLASNFWRKLGLLGSVGGGSVAPASGAPLPQPGSMAAGGRCVGCATFSTSVHEAGGLSSHGMGVLRTAVGLSGAVALKLGTQQS